MKTLTALLLTLTALPLAADEFDRWTWRNPKPLGNGLQSVVHANEKFVAVGDWGDIVTSPDGREWTIQTSGTVHRFLGVNHGGGHFVAYGNRYDPTATPTWQANLAVSPDGEHWTSPQHNLTSEIKGMAYWTG